MKTKNKLLAGVLCLLMLVICLVGLSSCGKCKHEYGDWTVKFEADCTKVGVREHTCVKCGETELEGIMHLGHDYTAETVNAETLKTAADCTHAAVYYKTCSRCGEKSSYIFEDGNALGHDYTAETVKEEALLFPAKCTSGALYCKSCDRCGEISKSTTDTFVSGNPIAHTYDQEIPKEAARKSPADCTSPAVYYKSCACGAVSTNNAETFTNGDRSHAYTQRIANADTLKTAADCTNAAVYYKSCSCGAVSPNAQDTFTGDPLGHTDENTDHICDNNCGKNDVGVCSDSDTDSDHVCDYGCGKKLNNCVDNDNNHLCDVCGETVSGHNYQIDETQTLEATCTEAKKITEVCTICGDPYQYSVGDANGHNINGVTPREVQDNTCECKYTLVYTCKSCSDPVNGETVYHHTYTASITKAATCKASGEKTFTCSKCDASTELHTKTEEIAIDTVLGHTWATGTVTDGVKTDTCSLCRTTKTVREYTGGNTGSIDSGALSGELKIDNIGINMDEGAAGAVGTGNVTVSAGALDTDARDEALSNVDSEKRAQVGSNPIYNFSVVNSTGNVSSFGENNYVTITIPYTLSEGEDVDSIAVWFINGSGELESIKATYNNGFVTFKTNHFSYYTVTKLTPAERCALYGHVIVKNDFTLSCTQDGYTLEVCIRCGNREVKNLVKATGHDYNKVTVSATCTVNGSETYTCKNSGCSHSYAVTLYATGHNYVETDSQTASCTQNGYTKYKCENCQGENTVYVSKSAHECEDTTVGATCETNGYTLHKCNNCDYEYKDSYVTALGHSYVVSANGWTWADDKSSATFTVVCNRENCTHDGVALTASIAKSVISGGGVCSDFVKTTYTATAVYNGQYYTDIKTETVGTPNHAFKSAWVKDGNRHWHECACGEKTEISEHTFVNAVVTKAPTCVDKGESTAYCVCGATKVSETAATGEHTYSNGVCTVCDKKLDDVYYYNLINSWKKADGFAFKIKKLTYSSEELKSGKKEWSGITFDFSEIMLSFKDGELGGAGIGKATVYNMKGYGETETYACRLSVKDGWIYIYVDADGEVMVVKQLLEAVTKSLIDSSSNYSPEIATPAEMIGGMAVPVIKFVNDTVVPAVETLAFVNSDKVNTFFKNLFEMLFTFEQQEDGTFVATLDYDKLLALNENLATKSIDAVIDTYFGNGAFDSIVALIPKALDLKVGEVPSYLKALGIKTEDFIKDVNDLMAALGMEGFDLNAIITSADYKDFSVGYAIFGQNMTSEEYAVLIAQYTEPLKSVTTYDLVISIISSIVGSEGEDGNGEDFVGGNGSDEGFENGDYAIDMFDTDGADSADGNGDTDSAGSAAVPSAGALALKEMIDGIIGEIKDFNASISFTTTGEGELTDVKLKAKTEEGGFEYGNEYGQYKLKLDLEMTLELDGRLDTDDETIGDVAGDVDENIVSPGENVRTEYDCNYFGSYADGEISGSIYKLAFPDYTVRLSVAGMPNCTGWVQYEDVYAARELLFAVTVTERASNGSVTAGTIIDLSSGKTVGFRLEGRQWKVILEDNTEKNVGIETLLLGVMEYAKLYISAFGSEGGELSYSGYYLDYYYNTETKAFATKSQHKIKYEYELKNGEGSSCEDGYIKKTVCTVCEKVLSRSTYNEHDTVVEEQVFELTGTCGANKATLYKCPCGQYREMNVSGECEFEERSTPVWLENTVTGTQIAINESTKYFNQEACIKTCAVTDPACGYKIRYARYWLADANECVAYEYETWQFGYTENGDGTYTCAKEYTFKTGNKQIHHKKWVAEDGEIVCDCGSYYKVTETTSNGKMIVTKRGHSTVADVFGGYSYTDYEKVETYCNEIELKEVYEKITCADGSVYTRTAKFEAYTATDKFPYKYTKGEKATYVIIEFNGDYTKGEVVNVWYKGHSYMVYTHEYYNEDGTEWNKWDCEYSFDAKNGCKVKTTFTNSNGAKTERTESCCKEEYHGSSGTTVKAPTCTQDGLKAYGEVCSICGKASDGTDTVNPTDHAWVRISDSLYHCAHCGLENANGASGDIVMEDMTEEDGEYYVVGYWNRGSYTDYMQNVTLVLADGTEVLISDIEITEVEGMRAYRFKKSDVTSFASANGYTDYEVRFSIVPAGGEADLDYAVTFAEPTVVGEEITDNVSFKDYISDTETKYYTIKPTVDAEWVFIASSRDCAVLMEVLDSDDYTLYFAESDVIQGVYYIKFSGDLKAGETYTVMVKWSNELYYAGNMNLFFGYAKAPAAEGGTENN